MYLTTINALEDISIENSSGLQSITQELSFYHKTRKHGMLPKSVSMFCVQLIL